MIPLPTNFPTYDNIPFMSWWDFVCLGIILKRPQLLKILKLTLVTSLILLSSCDLFNPEFPKKVRDIDGNVYRTVKIGDQLWMAENLKVTHYRNGEEISFLAPDSAWALDTAGTCDILGAYCAYDNDIDCADTCGYLYNWYAVNNPNGLAPEGWHVPTDEEWKQLELFIGMDPIQVDTMFSRGTIEGKKLKSTYNWELFGEGTDEYGFNALPCGFRYVNLTISFLITVYTGLGYSAHFWTSTEKKDTYQRAWIRSLDYGSSTIDRGYNSKNLGLSVRCIKDNE